MRIVSLLAFVIAGCGGVDRCAYDVPFAIDRPMNLHEMAELRQQLHVASIEGMCMRVCSTLELEDPPMSDVWSYFRIDAIDECTLVVPTVGDNDEPIDGLIRCRGTGTLCPRHKD
jgi:hypothetical protein